MVSMKDIANKINVSRCTVSDILNGKTSKYRQQTIDLVLNTANEMGYLRNELSRSLKTGKSGTIALVIPDIANTFYVRIYKEIERLAYSANFSLITCITEENLEKEEEILKTLSGRMVDGILISTVSSTQSLRGNYPFQIVCFDRATDHGEFPSITIDNENAASSLAKRFIEKGAKEPLFIGTSPNDYTIRLRTKGFVSEFQNHGFEIPNSHILYDIYDDSSSYELVNGILNYRNLHFDSIALSTNYYIYGVLRALKEHGVTLTALGGFEDFSGSFFFDNIICVNQPEREIASCAFEALTKLLHKEKADSIVLNTYIR